MLSEERTQQESTVWDSKAPQAKDVLTPPPHRALLEPTSPTGKARDTEVINHTLQKGTNPLSHTSLPPMTGAYNDSQPQFSAIVKPLVPSRATPPQSEERGHTHFGACGYRRGDGT